MASLLAVPGVQNLLDGLIYISVCPQWIVSLVQDIRESSSTFIPCIRIYLFFLRQYLTIRRIKLVFGPSHFLPGPFLPTPVSLCKYTTMHFADFSTLLLLASTVSATPRHHRKGKWEHSSHHSSFASLLDVSTGFTMPAGTGTAPVIPQGTRLVSPPSATVSSISSTESGGDDTEKERTEPEPKPGLPSSSAPAKAVSSTAAAAASSSAPTTPASSPSGGVSYTATFTEYVFLYFGPLPFSPSSLTSFRLFPPYR